MTLPLQRFNLMATTSYAALDIHWKGHLKHLHDDYLESRQVSIVLCCLPWDPPCAAAHLAVCHRSQRQWQWECFRCPEHVVDEYTADTDRPCAMECRGGAMVMLEMHQADFPIASAAGAVARARVQNAAGADAGDEHAGVRGGPGFPGALRAPAHEGARPRGCVRPPFEFTCTTHSNCCILPETSSCSSRHVKDAL